MTRCLALYSGNSLSDARLVAISSDPTLIHDLAERLIREPLAPDDDPVVASIDRGRRAALSLIAGEVADASGS